MMQSNRLCLDMDQLKLNQDHEVSRGENCKNQLIIWDHLLEFRIKAQKMLINANRLPQHNVADHFKANQEYAGQSKRTVNSLKRLMDSLVKFQDRYSNRIIGKGTDGNEEIPSDSEVEDEGDNIDDDEEEEEEMDNVKTINHKRGIHDYEDNLAKRHKNFIETRNEIIMDTFQKAKFSMPTKKMSMKVLENSEESPINQLKHILEDRNRIIRRTQVKRSNYTPLGVPYDIADPQDQQNSEIFDDDDFYHQLLRELIENKTVDSSDPIAMSRKWLEIQKLRSKMKKKVDLKASKGRKTRYETHNQLVNFMAPIDKSPYTDEAKEELFDSLFH